MEEYLHKYFLGIMTDPEKERFFEELEKDAALKEEWKRETKVDFFSCPSSCGFKNIAHRAGLSVKAFNADKPIEIAIVKPNWR